ncbi:methylated-DNA--[protein]-cysteine S-methyltransferase [Kosmotoga pacifica]|uniref:Methylated-DNA--protein-cysteine methyltransferase n=1 Tax=Kosmotoga pacifica TaxID=1330330 RepID=A0A0G2Z5M2_9BACT|nr:methylated-DNA--[protein]-cysteine S-methyltransferase [Kosmotoga pacifica]AKI96915.1 hypothetical protein IX53_02725 [Kosmotoga pacifica]
MERIGIVNIPLGSVIIEVESGKLIAVRLTNEVLQEKELSIFTKQFKEYFAGKRKIFDLPYVLELPEFSKRVLEYIRNIPYGQVMTYKQVAEALGKPGGARAVGQAMRRNPLPVLFPCHRVVAKDGMGGFLGGQEWKQFLLSLEGSRYVAK